MQSVSAQFTGQSKGDSGLRVLKDSQRLLMSFLKNYNSSVSFFTIGTSVIGGADIIKGDGSVVAEWDKYDYTDYSGCLMDFQYTRELDSAVGSMVAAMADFTVNNTDKKFTPGADPTIGAYILPKRPIKLFTGFMGVSIPVFGGITEKIPQIDDTAKTAKFHCIDNLAVINNTPLDTAVMYQNYSSDAAIAALLQLCGLSASQYVLDAGANIIPFLYFPKGAKVGEIIRLIVEAEMGYFYQDESGILRFEGRDYNARNANRLVSQATFNKDNCYEISQPDVSNVVNVVEVKSNVRAVQAKQKLWELQSGVMIPAAVGTARTNLITNPSFETNTTGWLGTTATLSQDATQFYIGTKSLKAIITSANGYAAFALSGLTSGVSYGSLARVKATAGKTIFIRHRVGGVVVNTASFTASGGWDNVQVAGNIAATSGILEIGCTTTDTIYIDQVLHERASSPGTYFDGTTTDTAIADYAWSGTAHASTSTYTPRGTVDIFADFTDDDGALPVTTVDTPLYLDTATTSAYATNTAQDGTGTNNNGAVALFSTSQFATSYKMTFVNTSASPMYVSALSLFATPAKVVQRIYVRKEDTLSTAKYDEQPIKIENDFIQSEAMANSIGPDYHKRERDPRRYSRDINPWSARAAAPGSRYSKRRLDN
jgi:hypothetical protein